MSKKKSTKFQTKKVKIPSNPPSKVFDFLENNGFGNCLFANNRISIQPFAAANSDDDATVCFVVTPAVNKNVEFIIDKDGVQGRYMESYADIIDEDALANKIIDFVSTCTAN